MRRADRRSFSIAYAAWLFGLFAYFIPPATWNPVSRFNLTRAVVEQGSLRVDSFVTSTGDRAHVNGHWYSDKAPVPAVLAIPAYALVHVYQNARGISPAFEAYATAKTPAVRVIPNRAFQQGLYVSSIFTSGVAGVALGLLTFQLLRRRTTSPRAFGGSVAAVLGTSIFPYGTTMYGHVLAAALILGAIVCLDARGQRPTGGIVSNGRLRAAGACFALAAGTEYLVAIPVAVIGLWFVLVAPSKRRLHALLQIGLGGVMPALLVAGYHTLVFGAPWRTGYSFETQPEFVQGHASGLMGIHAPRLEGLWGLTVGFRRGLFYVAPLTLIGIVLALRHTWRRRDWAFGAGLSVLGILLVLNAGYYMWWGGASAGPRHLIPGMAFAAAGVAFYSRRRLAWLSPLILVLAAVSIANAVAIALVGVEAPERGDLLRDFVWKRFADGRIAALPGASNLGIRMGLSTVASVVPLLVWLVLGFAYLRRQIRRGSASARYSAA
jgi:hypothetical protein